MALALKYGCNPHQRTAAAELGADAPVRVLAGKPSMINMLDALNGWQLVAELKAALQQPAAASFKHVSPAGAAVAAALPEELRRAYEIGSRPLTPLATAYARARGTDPKCSFGDFVALSEPVDAATAAYLGGVVSDGVVAPGFEPGTLDVLAAKKGGTFVVVEANPSYDPPPLETREVFGVRLTQRTQPLPHRLGASRSRGVRPTHRSSRRRSGTRTRHPQVHPIEFDRLRSGRPNDRRWRRPSNHAWIARSWQGPRRTSGIWAATRRYRA